MTIDQKNARQAVPGDILESINRFRHREIDLAHLLNIMMDQIHDLQGSASVDIGELEDIWTDIEIIYALASEAQQSVLTPVQAAEVEDAIDRMAKAVSKAL